MVYNVKKHLSWVLLTIRYLTNVSQVNLSQIRKHFSDLEQAADDWVPVELELVDRMWIPDAEILKLKGFRCPNLCNFSGN